MAKRPMKPKPPRSAWAAANCPWSGELAGRNPRPKSRIRTAAMALNSASAMSAHQPCRTVTRRPGARLSMSIKTADQTPNPAITMMPPRAISAWLAMPMPPTKITVPGIYSQHRGRRLQPRQVQMNTVSIAPSFGHYDPSRRNAVAAASAPSWTAAAALRGAPRRISPARMMPAVSLSNPASAAA
jgi:hypothetical protein